MAWRDFLEKVDPDVIIGYNIANFDFPYLLDRAKHLKCNKFPYWTRLKSQQSAAKETNFSSKQMGNRDTKATNTNGRLQLDLLQLIQRDHQLRSYTLNFCVFTLSGRAKGRCPPHYDHRIVQRYTGIKTTIGRVLSERRFPTTAANGQANVPCQLHGNGKGNRRSVQLSAFSRSAGQVHQPALPKSQGAAAGHPQPQK